jgi:hypothetical protein
VTDLPVERLLLVPLVLWTAHVAASFALVEAHCRHGAIDGELAGISAIRLLLLALTAVALLALGGNALAASRAWLAPGTTGGAGTGARSQLLVICAAASGVALLYLAFAVVFATEARLCR